MVILEQMYNDNSINDINNIEVMITTAIMIRVIIIVIMMILVVQVTIMLLIVIAEPIFLLLLAFCNLSFNNFYTAVH